MSESHIQEHETQEPISYIVPEGASVTPEPVLAVVEESEEILVKTTIQENTVAPVYVGKPGRLSNAFKAISCGLCLHPWKSNNPADYHSLVVTPGDEDGPILGEDSHHNDSEGGASGKAITEDFKELHITEEAGAGSSTDFYGSSLDVETKVVEEGQNYTEEITILDVDESAASNAVVESLEISEQKSEESQLVAAAVIAPEAVKATNTPIRISSPFAKLVKRSSSTNNGPTSPTSNPLGRLGGRIAKIIRSSETSSSIQSKESKESSAKETVTTTTTTTTTTINKSSSDEAALGSPTIVEFHETVMSDDQETALLSEEPQDLETTSSLVVDTSIATSPVTIPGQPSSSDSTLWAQSPTLHQNDVSITSSLAKRASTVGSANGSETGSVGSNGGSGNGLQSSSVGKDSNLGDLKKRKNSVLKKLGKAIKTSKDKVDRRLSRQGSVALDSPLEVEETNA